MVLKMCKENNNVLKLEKNHQKLCQKKKNLFLNESQKISLEHLNNLGKI